MKSLLPPELVRTGFVAENGTAVILRYSGPADSLKIYGVYLRRPGDDSKFYRLHSDGSDTQGTSAYGDARSDERFGFVYNYDENTLVWCGEAFAKDNSIIDKAAIVQLPGIRNIEYLCGNDDTMFLVTAPKEGYSYGAFHVYIGNGDGTDMRLIPYSSDVQRMRDGGSTSFNTAEGMFYSPAPHKKHEYPSLGDRELHHLDPSQYVIDETDGVATITRKE